MQGNPERRGADDAVDGVKERQQRGRQGRKACTGIIHLWRIERDGDGRSVRHMARRLHRRRDDSLDNAALHVEFVQRESEDYFCPLCFSSSVDSNCPLPSPKSNGLRLIVANSDPLSSLPLRIVEPNRRKGE